MSYVFSIKIFSYYYIIQFDLILIRYIIRCIMAGIDCRPTVAPFTCCARSLLQI